MMDVFALSYVVLWGFVIVEGVAIFLLAHSLGTVYLSTRDGISRDGLAIGSRAPEFEAEDAEGGRRPLKSFLGKWLVLVFAAPTCQICWRLTPNLPALRKDIDGHADVLLLLRGDRDAAREYQRAIHDTLPVFAIGKRGVAEHYKVRVSPFVHILDPAGVIRAKGLVNSVENIEHLLYEAGMRHPRLAAHAEVD
jgi:methylamine dehydrogenase accessory protein MauD